MIVQANALHIPLAPQSVHCVVTSPPYWGLRDYAGTAMWIGGDSACDHAAPEWADDAGDLRGAAVDNVRSANSAKWLRRNGGACPKCGAVRTGNQLGSERVPDCLGWATGNQCGTCYVCHMVQVARELWRVLRDDGTWWLNLGDSFTSGNRKGNGTRQGYKQASNRGMSGKCDPMRAPQPEGLKPKDLIGIPWRVALALQADGWYLRSDVIWAKPNPMPESVTDRPTKAHEYVFLLAKSERYYYDAEAVKESSISDHPSGNGYKRDARLSYRDADGARGNDEQWQVQSSRNRRTVWTVATQPYAGAHYATYPPALIEPCVLASTSARGCCPTCGAQWERVTEREFVPQGDVSLQCGMRGTGDQKPMDKSSGWQGVPRGTTATNTLGWAPACDCPPAEPVPAIVLDPFVGSGTTVAVARLHGRRGIGLDLSMTYLRENALPRAEGKQSADALASLPLFADMDPAA